MSSIDYYNFFQNHPTAAFILDDEGEITKINRAFTAITGYESEDMVGRTIDGIFSRKDKRRTFQFYDKKNQYGNQTFSQDISLRTKDESKREVRLNMNFYWEKNASFCTLEDISEKKELSRQLDEENQKLETILTYLGEGVIVCNENREILRINKKARELLVLKSEHGVVLTRQSTLGKDLLICFPQEYHGEIKRNLEIFSYSPEEIRTFRLEMNNRILKITYSPIFTIKEEFIGTTFMVQDITKEIEAEKFKMEAMMKELEIAKKIQTSLLPPESDLKESRHYEISAQMIPAEEVGGDYYDFIPGPDSSYWFTIGDVTGHGLNSGLIMMMAQVGVLTSIYLDPQIPPEDLYSKLNQVLYTNVRERMDRDDYMTLSLLRGDKKGHFYYVGAHEDILIYRQNKGFCERLATEGIWLGILPEISEKTYRGQFQLEPGDFMVLITDGIIEIRNQKGEQFDFDRLIEVIEKNSEQSMEALRDQIIFQIREFSHLQRDDMTLMAVRKRQSQA